MFLSRGHGVYTIARGTFDGELILLAPRVSVARTPNPSRSLETDTDRRRRFHAHVSSPRFKVEDNLIVEEFIAGRHFGTLDPTAQSECIKRMIGEYTALTRAEGKGTSDSIVHDAARLLEQLSRPAGFPDPVAFRRCVDDAAKWRLVPTAADPQVQNIIVADGNRPIVIDLASMILAPSAYFPLGLLMSAGVPMLQAYLGGEFDAELTELLRASSAVFGATHEDRTALLAVSAAIATRYEARRLSATSDPARLQAILDDSWGLCATLV